MMERSLHEGNTPRIAAIIVGSILALVIVGAAAWVFWLEEGVSFRKAAWQCNY
jgi:hypothetical protein